MTWVWWFLGVGLAGAVLLFVFVKAAEWFLPAVDPLHGDAKGHELVADLKFALGWKQTHEFLLSVEDPALRGWYCDALNLALKAGEGDRERLGAWVEAVGQGSSIPYLFRGISRVYWGWEARGSGTGDTVTEDMAERFVERLALAQVDLREALERDPQDAAPFGFMIAIAKGVGLELPEIATIYARSREVDPLHVATAYAMLGALCEKWHGSHEQMFGFARERLGEAPAGHLLAGLIPAAHIERWLYFLFEDDPQGAEAYFKQPEVRAEVHEAFSRLGSANLPSNHLAVQAWNDFAFCFWRMGDRPAAQRCFTALERKHVTELPWSYLDDNAVNTFEEIKRSFGLKPG